MHLRHALSVAVLVLVACGQSAQQTAPGRYDRQQLERTLASEEPPAGVLLGEFILQNKGVVDGDTIKVVGLDASLRLIGLDCEETFKSDKAWRAYEVGFDEYLRNEQKKTPRPVKVATPLGMDAKKFALDFFADVNEVRLERDHPKDVRDRYNRHLAYVFAKKGGKWVNYNLECIRAGMSPYFDKYGRATRFHDAFVAAQNEARAAGRGIWDPKREHYRDYDARLAWWNARAAFVTEFQEEAQTRDDLITLTHWDSLDRLEGYLGDEVEILATVGDIRMGSGGAPTRVMLARRMFNDFALIFFDDEVFSASRIAEAKGEFVRVRGTVSEYEFKGKRGRAGEKQLQIVVKRPEQVSFVDTWSAAAALMPAAPSPPPGDPTVPDPEAVDDTVASPTSDTRPPATPASPSTAAPTPEPATTETSPD
jgi:endonuclease YncB( thermonuclease family)